MRIELRSDSVVLDGYVNVTQRESRILPSPRGKFVEEIMPRTFERALQKTDSVDLLFNHNHSRKLGSTKTGELELREDNVGLRAIAVVTDSEVMDKARKGELRGWSFGFSVLKDTWKQREDGMQKRTVEDIELYEVSVLDKTPAYVAQSLEARGEEDSVLTEVRTEDFEAKVEDNSENTEDKTVKTDEPKKQEENRENPEPHYFEHLEKELTLLQLKGGNFNK
jgi:HK97 family phage prohead protease